MKRPASLPEVMSYLGQLGRKANTAAQKAASRRNGCQPKKNFKSPVKAKKTA